MWLELVFNAIEAYYKFFKVVIVILLITTVIFIVLFILSFFKNSDNSNEIIHAYLKGNYKMEITIDSETNKADTVYLLK